MTEQLALFDIDPLLDKHQVAQRLNVGIRFVERLIAEKRIAYIKVGRHVESARQWSMASSGRTPYDRTPKYDI